MTTDRRIKRIGYVRLIPGIRCHIRSGNIRFILKSVVIFRGPKIRYNQWIFIPVADLKGIVRLSDDLAIIQDDSQYIADIKAFLFEFYTQDALNASKYVYLFSQQGYALLIKFLKSDLGKQIYKQMVREYFGMKAATEDCDATRHWTCRVRCLSHAADDNAALEKMFRKRRQLLTGMGFDKSNAVLKSVESIRHAHGH